ncbi:FOXN4 isoform 5, partial [Pan troglodytes]
KNSKTGSLPVSEIYSFMKEHFPYFKTAPDGWKNSVRHNLSLNKCFEKVDKQPSIPRLLDTPPRPEPQCLAVLSETSPSWILAA